MPYPNSALSAGQLTVIAVVAVLTLAIWLGAVFIAARQPARRDLAAAGTPEGTAAASAASAAEAGQVPEAGQVEPAAKQVVERRAA